jgi:SAM-dependent methyltransferase
MLPDLVAPLLQDQADAVFGSRMLASRQALKGGMPLYKYIGNRILSTFQNRVLRANLSEFHSGYRAYSVETLAQIPFEYNTNDFHFDTEIIIQLLQRNARIKEIPIPTYYGEEICYVNGLAYAWNVVKATILSRIQGLGLLFHRKFDLDLGESRYVLKMPYDSSHTRAFCAVPQDTSVLDIGCGPGLVSAQLKTRKQCQVTGVDRNTDQVKDLTGSFTKFVEWDLDSGTLPPLGDEEYEVLLLLDVIEHLRSPESLLDDMRRKFGSRRPRLIITTGNIAFILIRLSLLFGLFNYGPRGILDFTHVRLFTFRTVREILEQSGFEVTAMQGIPAPFPLALGNNALSRLLVRLNSLAIKVSRPLFSYQIYAEARAVPTIGAYLAETIEVSATENEPGSKREAGIT